MGIRKLKRDRFGSTARGTRLKRKVAHKERLSAKRHDRQENEVHLEERRQERLEKLHRFEDFLDLAS